MSECATFCLTRRTLRGSRNAPPGKARHFFPRTFPTPVKKKFHRKIAVPEGRAGPKRLIGKTAWCVGAHKAGRLARFLAESAVRGAWPEKRELESRINFRQQ
ncbi:hypothetical protein [Paraburkholderia sp. 32]|uniref:hypothetical protein n=1 Tax=Paraburkholderia sp. 32 TaxID=2991057 RepID=UPI003D1EC010